MRDYRPPAGIAALLLSVSVSICACGGGEPEPAADMHASAELPPYNPAAFEEMDDGWLRSYLQGHDALVHDRAAEAKVALAALAAHLEGDAAELARAAAAAEGLEAVRTAFRPLSAALKESELPEGYAVAYCPMAFEYEGGYWLQEDGEIANPYYGAKMLRCGVLE